MKLANKILAVAAIITVIAAPLIICLALADIKVEGYSVRRYDIDSLCEKIVSDKMSMQCGDGTVLSELVDIEIDKFALEGRLDSMGIFERIKNRDIHAPVIYKWNKKVLKVLNAKVKKKPKNAAIKIENASYIVEKEKYGKITDLQTLQNALDKWCADDMKLEYDDTGRVKGFEDYYKKAEITESSDKFQKLLEKVKKAGKQKFKIKYNDKVFYKAGKLSFMKVTDNKLTASDKKISDIVKQIDNDTSTLNQERKFKTVSGSKITLQPGTLGWKLDNEKTIEAIKNSINNSETVELVWSSKGGSFTKKGEDDIGNKYVEVSLDQQKVWFVKDGEVVWSSDCVTGLPTVERHTKPGAHQILYKQRDRVLRGSRRAWSSFVSYWMPFTWDGQGLHDASWRGSFGGSIWRSSGSHGCVNLPKYKAAELYNLVEQGTPVLVY